MNFKDKVVLVTGGSSGIGAATAIKFAAEQAKVAIIGRNTSKLDKVSKICESEGSKPLVIVADLTKEDDARKVVNTTIQYFKRLDVLVNCAGKYGAACIMDHDALTIFDDVMTTNFRSPVYLTSLAAPYLIYSKGNIVNISSTGADSVLQSGGTSAFCASKAALEHFTRCMAVELGPSGVRVNAIKPGSVKTDIIKNMGVTNEEILNKIWKYIEEFSALERVSEPEEIADLVLYLASDKAKGITGSSIISDNGSLFKEIKEY